MKKADGYIRVAGDNRGAIDEQKRNIEYAAFYNEYKLENIFIDSGDGGSLRRKGIHDLMKHARKGDIDVILVNSMDELSTDESVANELLRQLSAINVHVYSVDRKEYLN